MQLLFIVLLRLKSKLRQYTGIGCDYSRCSDYCQLHIVGAGAVNADMVVVDAMWLLFTVHIYIDWKSTGKSDNLCYERFCQSSQVSFIYIAPNHNRCDLIALFTWSRYRLYSNKKREREMCYHTPQEFRKSFSSACTVISWQCTHSHTHEKWTCHSLGHHNRQSHRHGYRQKSQPW